jgi:hypothetical protein
MSLRTAYPTFFRLHASLARRLAPFFRLLTAAARLIDHILLFRWWTWHTTRRLVFTSAVLLTLIAVAYAVENWRGRRAFAAVTREAAAAGLSFTSRDHAQPPVPDNQNLAKLPLFDAPADAKLRDDFWNKLNADLNPQRKDRTTRTTPTYLPNTGRPSPLENRPADLAALRAEMDALAVERDEERLDAYLARLTPLLADLSTATVVRPYLRYDYDWTNPVDITLPQVGPLRTIAQVATLQALVHLENNRPADAARSLGVPLSLRAAVQRDPFLISQLTAIAIDATGTSAIWQGQLDHRWTTAELEFFAKLLADDQILDSFHNAYTSEAAGSVTILLQLPESLRIYDSAFTSDNTTRSLRPIVLWAPSGWVDQNAAFMGRYFIDEVIPSIDPTAGRIHPEKIKPRDYNASPPRPYSAIANLIMPSVGKLAFTVGRSKTTHDLARLAMELERHYLAHGAYPESLTPVLAADPALAVLHDPFTGEPYRYRCDADGGFTLWGVGQNLRDDGAAYPANHGNDRADYSTGDLVWHVPGAAQKHD